MHLLRLRCYRSDRQGREGRVKIRAAGDALCVVMSIVKKMLPVSAKVAGGVFVRNVSKCALGKSFAFPAPSGQKMEGAGSLSASVSRP